MTRKKIQKFTEREADLLAENRGKRIERLTSKPLSYAAAIKRLAGKPEGFLVWDDTTSRYFPAVLSDE